MKIFKQKATCNFESCNSNMKNVNTLSAPEKTAHTNKNFVAPLPSSKRELKTSTSKSISLHSLWSKVASVLPTFTLTSNTASNSSLRPKRMPYKVPSTEKVFLPTKRVLPPSLIFPSQENSDPDYCPAMKLD